MIVKAKVEDLNKIINLYNKVTRNLQSKNINQWNYPWDIKDIRKIINQMYIYSENDNIVACFVVRTMEKDEEFISKDDYYVEKIAILPEFQGKGKIDKIIKYIIKIKEGKNCYLDCWSGNEKLKSIYKKYGEYMGDYSENNYYISIFKLG